MKVVGKGKKVKGVERTKIEIQNVGDVYVVTVGTVAQYLQ